MHQLIINNVRPTRCYVGYLHGVINGISAIYFASLPQKHHNHNYSIAYCTIILLSVVTFILYKTYHND